MKDSPFMLKVYVFNNFRKKNGEKCTMFVNKRLCNYCIYHAQKEYKKYCGGRSELQKATGGNLRQMLAKKMGWNTVSVVLQFFLC